MRYGVPRRVRPLLVALIAAVAVVAARPRAAGQQLVTVPPAVAADLAAADRLVNQMLRTGNLRVRDTVADTMMAGRAHERLEQYYRGVRIFGGDLARQVAADGTTVSIFGQVYPELNVDTSPLLTVDQAFERIPSTNAEPSAATTELVLLPLDSGAFALAYRIATRGIERMVYFVDVRSGTLLRQYSNVQRADVIGNGLRGW